MSLIEREGQIHLKPVDCQHYNYPSGDEALKFAMVDKDGNTTNATISKKMKSKDGGEKPDNPDILIFCEAYVEQKSILCEVKKGREKKDGGFWYEAKWSVTKKSDNVSLTKDEIRKFLKEKAEHKPEEVSSDSSVVPF